MDSNHNSLESYLLAIKRDQEQVIKKELDKMRIQVNEADDSIKSMKHE
jgi:hypothetical protein